MTENHARPIVVATYNIHYSIGTDRQFAPRRVAEVIHSLHADVVALQEVGWHYRGQAGVDQFELLAQLTGLTVLQGLSRSHPNAHFGNAILTHLPVRRSSTLDLSVPLRAPRCALIAELESSGGAIRVVNVHLGLDPWERRTQVSRLISALDEDTSMPTLMLGDFNEWRGKPAYLEAVDRRLPECAKPESFHARRPMLRYDRIYASAHLKLDHARTVHAPPARRASDHLPVVASFLWRSAASAPPAAATP